MFKGKAKEPELRAYLTPAEREKADALSVFPANEMELIRLERIAEERRAILTADTAPQETYAQRLARQSIEAVEKKQWPSDVPPQEGRDA